MLEYLARFPRRFARHYCLTANTIRYVIEYRCIVRLISKSNLSFRRLIDVGAGSGEMSARLIEQGFAETAIAIEPDPQNSNYYSAATAASKAAAASIVPWKHPASTLRAPMQSYQHKCLNILRMTMPRYLLSTGC